MGEKERSGCGMVERRRNRVWGAEEGEKEEEAESSSRYNGSRSSL